MIGNEPVRLNKYLAQCGVCSRRDADKIIGSGTVTVNGQPAAMGTRVLETDEVCIRGKQIKSKSEIVVLAFNKPAGITCTEKDKFAKQNIIEYLNYPQRITYAGRLDRDSEGLILMTNDGDLIQGMMRGAAGHEKEYIVTVDKMLTAAALDKMREGIYLKELETTTRPCTVEQTGEKTFRIILTQGLNRQIRRMCQATGYEVRKLKRIRVMNIELGSLKKGEYRELKKEEIEELWKQIR